MDKQVIIQVKPNRAFFKKFSPQQFNLKEGGLDKTDEENYEHVGAFKMDAFLGTHRPLTPKYNLNTMKWGFKGSLTDLKELVDKIQLRYERGDRKGQVIKSIDVDINNRYDAFFDHSEMKVNLENGKAKLTLENSKDRFLYLCLTEDPDISNAKDADSNPYRSQHQKFEMIDVAEQKAKKAGGLDARIEAYSLFGNIKNNFDRLLSVARALDIIKEEKPEDPTALVLELENRWVLNVNLFPNSTKTFQEIFISTAQKNTEELNRMYLVNFGIWKSILRPRTFEGFWTMKTKTGDTKELAGVKSKDEAYKYFEDEKNYGDLEILMHLTNAFNTNG